MYTEKISRKRTLLISGVSWKMTVTDALGAVALEISKLPGLQTCDLTLRNAKLFGLNGFTVSADLLGITRDESGGAFHGFICLRFKQASEAMHVLREFEKKPLRIGDTICQVSAIGRRCSYVRDADGTGRFVDFLLPEKSSVYDSSDFTPLKM
jgi:hypothetical protein